MTEETNTHEETAPKRTRRKSNPDPVMQYLRLAKKSESLSNQLSELADERDRHLEAIEGKYGYMVKDSTPLRMMIRNKMIEFRRLQSGKLHVHEVNDSNDQAPAEEGMMVAQSASGDTFESDEDEDEDNTGMPF